MVEPQKLLEHLERKADHPMPLQELMRAIGIPKQKRREFRRLLREMVQAGKVVRTRGNRYGLPTKMNLVSGRLEGHPNGYGFVIPDSPGEGDVYIGRQGLLDAMHGDQVVARVEGTRPDGRREGRIIRILARGSTQVVGRFEWSQDREFGFVIPTDRRNFYDLFIPSDQTQGAREGDLVVAEIVQYPTPRRNPEGRIRTILGQAYDPKIDTKMIMAEFSLPMAFPKEVMMSARAIPDHVPPTTLRGRRDLRGLKTVTIDGERARDFDDAVSVEPLPRGQIRLYVHIADVGHYVPWGTPLDLEARQRGTSVYFPDQVVPLFPERLSNGILSLNPREDRLTLTVEMLFDPHGNRLGYDLYESVIRSNERMTYTEVARILVDRDPALCRRYDYLLRDFSLMEALAQRLRAVRMRQGSIDFDLPEPEIILDLQGQTLDIVREERNIAHRLIEEFMLAANRTVAEHLTKQGIPLLYRIHEPPDPDKIAELAEFLKSFGYRLEVHPRAHGPWGRLKPGVLQTLLEQARGRPEERLINHVVLRSMKQARYSSENVGHFGLAAETYTHFTSPIRRYPDLVVHRILKEVLQRGGLSAHRKSELEQLLPEIARTSSERERLAMEAEREVVDLKKVRFMEDKQGEDFHGFITGVTAFGFFVELEEILVEGLVHITSIPDDYYLFLEKEHCLLGRHHRRRFRIGDRVKVKVAQVDIQKRRIDFTLVDGGVRQRAARKSRY